MHTRVAVIGAGAGGQSIVGQLARSGHVRPEDITVFDPSHESHNQAAYTMVGGGVLGDSKTTKIHKENKYVIKPMSYIKKMQPGVNWQHTAVETFNPDSNELGLTDGTTVSYDYLIVNPGLKLRYDMIEGAQEALDDPSCPVGSIYTLPTAYKTAVLRENFKGGKAIFTMPAFPIKCGGAPQKITYLSEEHWRKTGVRDDTEIRFMGTPPVIFPPSPFFNKHHMKVAESKGVQVTHNHVLVRIDKDNRVAYFKNNAEEGSELVALDFDFLHVVPPQKAHDFIAGSPLAHENGWLDVDQFTLQHKKYPNVYGLGDSANLPCAKTAAAVFSQAPVVVNNVLRDMGKEKKTAMYDGYACCPVFVGDKNLMLCEFKYGNDHAPTFLPDQSIPNRLFYLMKREIFPRAYFELVPRGLWYGRNALLKPTF